MEHLVMADPVVERTVEKALRDPFYVSVVRRFGVEHLADAGFFDDGAPLDWDATKATDDRFIVTPLAKIRRALELRPKPDAARLAVLVTSGAFCPIHEGHLRMMESARRELAAKGWDVVGGFFAPDHDGYVGPKCGVCALSGAERVHLANVATEGSEWLAVDPWAALYVDRAINYTDILCRLSRYLTYHLKLDVALFYVCGGDNGGFSKAFVDSGGIVIVPRGKGDTPIDLHPSVVCSGRVFVARDHTPNEIASRKIRSGERAGLPARVAQELQKMGQREVVPNVTVFMRDEELWSVASWIGAIGDSLKGAQRRFSFSLNRTLERAFTNGSPDSSIEVRRVSLSEQRRVMKAFLSSLPLPTISLDACIEGDYSVGISRVFEVISGERLEGIFPRAGCPDLADQVRTIPSGRYVLMDDDIATGRTIRAFQDLLPPRIVIDRVLSMQEVFTTVGLRTVECSEADRIVEAGDLRDFLVGARDGGLVVLLPDGSCARAPYLLPYVHNNRRMSIPHSEELAFSKRVWELNAQFHENLPRAITVGDCPMPFQNLARYVGFSPATTLGEFCRWHLGQLGEVGDVDD